MNLLHIKRRLNFKKSVCACLAATMLLGACGGGGSEIISSMAQPPSANTGTATAALALADGTLERTQALSAADAALAARATNINCH
jgi:hypothetical protein